jgi:hypothetical protein
MSPFLHPYISPSINLTGSICVNIYIILNINIKFQSCDCPRHLKSPAMQRRNTVELERRGYEVRTLTRYQIHELN